MGSDVTQVERIQRVEIVFNLLLGGATRAEIIRFCNEKWEVKEDCVDKYMKDAREKIALINEGNLQDNRGWHIAHRFNLLARAKKSGNLSMELEAAKDVAKIQGLYIDRVQLTIGGKEDQQKTIEARKLLEGSEFKVIEPEGDSEYGS